MQWILTGQHLTALPFALRPENFDAIRANLGRLELRQQSLEQFLADQQANTIDRFNLSDVFEYVSPERYHGLLQELVRVSRNKARMAYWNLLAERRRPAANPTHQLAENFHGRRTCVSALAGQTASHRTTSQYRRGLWLYRS